MTIKEILNCCTIELLTNIDTKDEIYEYPFKIIFADKTEIIFAARKPMPWRSMLKVLHNDENNYININILFNYEEQSSIARYVVERYEKLYSDKRKSLFTLKD